MCILQIDGGALENEVFSGGIVLHPADLASDGLATFMDATSHQSFARSLSRLRGGVSRLRA